MAIFKELGHVPCYVCGFHVREREATIEHVIPKSKGGTKDKENLSISHFRCNGLKGSRKIEPKGYAPK